MTNHVSRETEPLVEGAIEHLRMQASDWGIRLSRTQLSLLSRYADLLAGYEPANVIGTKDQKTIILEHVLDVMSCFLVEDVRRANTAVDVGTGAGLPGIPLSIARPELTVTLLEAAEKKVRFLEHARASLDLRNVEVLHARAEDAGKSPTHREAFDLATARALAALPVVVEYCAPLVRLGGVILAMKGRLSEEELSKGVAASRELGVKLREVRKVEHQAQLPQKERRLVVLDKVDVTPNRFPRRVGVAKKRPLGT